MYQKAYGILETLAPLHVGASAGEETGNLNLIFRDQFTQTGIIPGSSIRGRFRADMREENPAEANNWYGHEAIEGQTDGGTTEALVKFEYASLVWLPVFCPGQPIIWVSCPLLLKRYKQSSIFQLGFFENRTRSRFNLLDS
jgi:CRISPR-associated protein Cmr4